MNFTKTAKADLDSPRRELSNGDLKSVATLLVRWQINFLSARFGRPIQLYEEGKVTIIQFFLFSPMLGERCFCCRKKLMQSYCQLLVPVKLGNTSGMSPTHLCWSQN